MSERPILFSAPMVRAILEDRKTQTRRPTQWERFVETRALPVMAERFAAGEANARCPYGAPGDQLWVRETYCMAERIMSLVKTPCYRATEGDINQGLKWTPSIYMRREHSRITLEVTGVRVERVQEISEADAEAEGLEREGDGWKSYEKILAGPHRGERHPHAILPNKSAVTSYRELWQSLNAERGLGWEKNPWVWVIEFRRV